MKTFKDKVVLVTGANRGIGKSLVKAVLEKGAQKVYATARDIGTMPDFGDTRVVPITLDITNVAQVTKVAEEAMDTQILINNAGVLHPGSVFEGTIDDMRSDMDTNYFGTIYMMRAFAPVLEKNAPANIINIASIAARSPLPFIAGYAASKAALRSATLTARTELTKKGVVVQIVNPGPIDTDINKGAPWDMPSPDDTARIILDEVETGKREIFPDKIGQEMYALWQEDPDKFYKQNLGE